jgi:pimeloyl-ACP methyl ester carboxylesterase
LSRILLSLFLGASAHAFAIDRLANVETRAGVTVEYWRMHRDGASATLILLPGGGGSLNVSSKKGGSGAPANENFLVRTRELFADAGFHVLIMGKPSDKAEMEAEFRASAEHVDDIRALAELARKEFGKPVWLVATSSGTISAAAAAAALPPGTFAGMVLSSSVTNGNNTVPVPSLDLPKVAIPVLVMHHQKDECRITRPDRAARIVERLKNAPVKKLVLLDGGSGAHGNACEPMHWHGYVGMEKEAVATITGFVRNPAP